MGRHEISIYPVSEGFTLLSNLLWTREPDGHPTLSSQHLWVAFPQALNVVGVRVIAREPISSVRFETGEDQGRHWLPLADWTLSGADVQSPQRVSWEARRMDNLRMCVKDDYDLFPTGDYVEQIFLCYEGEELPAFAYESLPVCPIGRKTVEVRGDFAGSPGLQIGEKRGLCHAPPRTDRLRITRKEGELRYRSPVFDMGFSEDFALITRLGWNTLGRDEPPSNLLCTENARGGFPVVMRGGQRLTSDGAGGELSASGRRVAYGKVRVAPELELSYRYRVREQGFSLEVDWRCDERFVTSEYAALRLPFDLYTSVTNVLALPNTTGPGGLVDLPLIVNCPNYGTMAVRVAGKEGTGGVYGRVSAFRVQAELWLDLIVGANPLENGLFEVPEGAGSAQLEFELTKVFPFGNRDGRDLFTWWEMPPFYSFVDREKILGALPNAWLNGFSFRPDMGVFANNSVSDYAMMCASYYADVAAYTPELAPGLSSVSLLKFAANQMLREKSAWRYTDHSVFPLGASAPVDCAWLYIAASGDWDWARRVKPVLEKKLKRLFDIEYGDTGLVASSAPDAPGAVTASWFDSFRSGNLESYVNAYVYRTYQRAEEIMERLGDDEMARALAKKCAAIRENYLSVFRDPRYGIYQWVARDGKGYGFDSHAHLGAAIAFGLVPEEEAREMLLAYLSRLEGSGFAAYEYGLPMTLTPVPEHLHNNWKGKGVEPDGSDQYGVYQNGSITHNQCYHILQALYKVGLRKEANELFVKLTPLARRGGLCGGLHSGLDWRMIDGSPAGYEGLLADQFHFLLAAITGYLGIERTLDGFKITGPDTERVRSLAKTGLQ